MPRNVTPERAIALTNLILTFTYCWPPPRGASRFQVVRFKIIRTVACLNIVVLFLPLLYAIHVYRGDAEKVAKAASLSIPIGKDILQTCVCISQYKRLQRLVEEMTAFCEKANLYERCVLQRYVNKYYTFYGVSAVWFYVTACTMVLGTLVISEPFPTNAAYPFPVNFEPVRSIVFVHQALVGVQVASHVCVSIFCALLLLFAAARFEILMLELRAIKDIGGLIECVKRYYTLKRYAGEIVYVFRYIIFFTVGVCAITAVCCGMTFIGRQPFTVKAQFICVAATAFMAVFMYALPADHLLHVSENAMQVAYESRWFEQSIVVKKSVLLVLAPQSPVAIRIRCIIPEFSLSYYCMFVSNVFSLFTSLRVVMMNEEDAT